MTSVCVKLFGVYSNKLHDYIVRYSGENDIQAAPLIISQMINQGKKNLTFSFFHLISYFEEIAV